jgi:hypothetical protein
MKCKHVNMHSPPLEGNFYGDHGKAMKLAIIQDCNRHMGCVDKSDHMMNSYCTKRCLTYFRMLLDGIDSVVGKRGLLMY